MARAWERLVEDTITRLRSALESIALEELGRSEHCLPMRSLVVDLVRKRLEVDDALRREGAVYLAFTSVPDHLDACFTLIRAAAPYETRILLRASSEALDLVDFLSSRECSHQQCSEWLSGKVLPHELTRRAAILSVVEGRVFLDRTPPEHEAFLRKDKVKTATGGIKRARYKYESKFVHHTSDVLVQAIEGRTEHGSDLLEPAITMFNGQLARACLSFSWNLVDDEKTSRHWCKYAFGLMKALFGEGSQSEAYRKVNQELADHYRRSNHKPLSGP